jgi:hypothetical protein
MKRVYTGFEGPWANYAQAFTLKGVGVEDYLKGNPYIVGVFADDTVGNVIAPGNTVATEINNKASLRLRYDNVAANSNTKNATTGYGTAVYNSTDGRLYAELDATTFQNGFHANYYMSVDAADTNDRVIASFIDTGDLYQVQFDNSTIKVFQSVGGGSYALFAQQSGLSFTGVTDERIQINIPASGTGCTIIIDGITLTFSLPAVTNISKLYLGVDSGYLDDLSINDTTGGVDDGATPDVKYVMVHDNKMVSSPDKFTKASDTETAESLEQYTKGYYLRDAGSYLDFDSGVVGVNEIAGDFIGLDAAQASDVSTLIAGAPSNVAVINTHFKGRHSTVNSEVRVQSGADIVSSSLAVTPSIALKDEIVSTYFKSDGTTPYTVSEVNASIVKFQIS